MKKLLGTAMLLGMLAAFAGCSVTIGGGDDSSSTTTTPVTTTTSTTSSTTSSTSSVDWPSDVPLNPDWEVTGNSSTNYTDSIYISKTQTCDSCTSDEVIKYYTDALTAQGWTKYSDYNSSSEEYGESVSVDFEKGDNKYVSIYYSKWDYTGTTIDISYSEYTY